MRTRLSASLAAIFLLWFQSSAFAQVMPGPDWTFEGYWHEYEETVGGAFFMANKGPFVSFQYGYNWKSGPLFLRVVPSLGLGSINYTSNGSGSLHNTFNFTFVGEMRAGADLPVVGGAHVVPWVGLGYRMHYDNKGGKVTSLGYYGYDRRSQYFYVPVGLSLSIPMGQDWVVEPEGIYKFFLSGKQSSYVSDVDPTCTDLKNKQDKGYGAEGSLGFQTHTSTGATITVGPFIRYWNIKESDIKPIYCGGALFTYALEPPNTTTEIGLRLRVRF